MVRNLFCNSKKSTHQASRSEQIQILTIMPKSWSIRNIQTEFGASNFAARQAKALVKEKCILSTLNPKPGRILPENTVDTVVSFMKVMKIED